MKELTPKQKLQAFANYLSQQVVEDSEGQAMCKSSEIAYRVYENQELNGLDDSYKLLLRPLSEITDEELKAFCFEYIPKSKKSQININRYEGSIFVTYNDLFGKSMWRISTISFECTCTKENQQYNVGYNFELLDYLRQIGIDAHYHGKTLEKWGLAVYQSDLDEKKRIEQLGKAF